MIFNPFRGRLSLSMLCALLFICGVSMPARAQFFVIASSINNGDAFNSAPITEVLTFSAPIDVTSFTSNDVTVNGVPLEMLTFDSTQTILTGSITPTTDGLQTLMVSGFRDIPSVGAAALIQPFSLTFTYTGPVSTTPEPSTYALLGSLGLTGAAFLRRPRGR